MWIEELSNGKYKYFERYRDPLTEKLKKVSITLDKVTPRAKKEAQRTLNEKIGKKLSSNSLGGKQTLEMVYDEWIIKYSNTVKISSLRHVKSLWKNADDRVVKKAIISNITSGVIQKWIDRIYYEENLSYSATDSYRAMLSNIFRYAKLNGYISSNPVSDVKIDKKKVDQSERTEEKFLEAEELEAVLSNLAKRSQSKRYANMMEFISLTGLRFGELAALKTEDYDGKVVHITKTLDYHYSNQKPVITDPKNIYSNRIVSLPDRAIEIIEQTILENNIRKSVEAYEDEGYIFSTFKGTPIFIGNVNQSLRNTKRALNLNKKLSTHTFRHTHISQLAELKLPIKSIMERVGHNSPTTTLKIYTHVTNNMKDDLLSQLNKKNKR